MFHLRPLWARSICLVPSHPHPTAPLHAPAVHNDGAGASPVALVHFPATRNGCEGQWASAEGKEKRNTHLWTSLSLLPTSPEQRREEGWREESAESKKLEVARGLPCHLQALCPNCTPATTDFTSLSLSVLTCKMGSHHVYMR